MEGRNSWSKTDYLKREIIIFELYGPEKKILKENKYYNQLKDILIRTKKNDHILFSADLMVEE